MEATQLLHVLARRLTASVPALLRLDAVMAWVARWKMKLCCCGGIHLAVSIGHAFCRVGWHGIPSTVWAPCVAIERIGSGSSPAAWYPLRCVRKNGAPSHGSQPIRSCRRALAMTWPTTSNRQ